MTTAERCKVFIKELRTYVEEHHHGLVKHTSLLNTIKYTRKKIKVGTLNEERAKEFEEIMSMRSKEHTGGRRKASHDDDTA